MERERGRMSAQTAFILASTVFFSLAVHGYRFVNSMFSHDSLLMIVQQDAAWQVALGRFFEPVLVFLRGDLCAPWLLCLLQMGWFAVSVLLLAELFKIRDRFMLLAVAGVVVSSEAFIAINASYLPCTDMYAFALFAALFGVWCIEKRKILYTLLGIAFMVASLSTYQAFISVAIASMLLLGVLRLCDFETSLGDALKRLLYYGIVLLCTAGIYYGVWQLVRRVLGIWEADTYNGMAALGEFGAGELFFSVATAYKNVFAYFASPDVMSNIVFRGMELAAVWRYVLMFVNLVVTVMILVGLFLLCRRQGEEKRPKGWQTAVRYLLVLLCLLLFPLACNFVCVMSKGMEHTLMMFGPTMLYVFGAAVAEKAGESEKKARLEGRMRLFDGRAAARAMALLLGAVVWVHFIYANQIYFKKAQQEKAAYSLLTRIVADVEEVPGYEPGVTPVAISGTFESAPHLVELPGFETIKPYSMGKTSLTYPGTDYAMIDYYLGIDIYLTRVDGKDPGVQRMPVYPAAGSVAMVDGVVVVKISE